MSKMMIVLFFAISAIGNNVLADGSGGKILGISLGDSLNSIRLPCNKKPEVDSRWPTIGSTFRCERNNGSSDENIIISFDKIGKVYSIQRTLKFRNEPRWDIISKDILNNYGSPDLKTTQMATRANDDNFPAVIDGFCYGGCEELAGDQSQQFWTGAEPRCNSNGNCLYVITRSIKSKGHYEMIFRAISSELEIGWQNDLKKYEQQKRAAESSIKY